MKTNLQNNKHKIKSAGALPEGDPILKRNTQRGITLVALIITVIVLLILAMVSIRLVMNGGIIDRAEKGTQSYTAEEIQEQIKLAYSEWQTAVWDGTSGDAATFIITSLQQKYGIKKVANDAVTVSNGKVTATIEGITYEYNTATGNSGKSKPGIGALITKDNYGDYIDLGQSVVGTSSTTDDWRILYNDKNGHVYAILADYLPNNNAAVTAAGFTSDKSGTYVVYSSISREDLLEKLNNTNAWKLLISNTLYDKGSRVYGATTAEIIMGSYNEKYETNIEYTSTPFLYIDNDSSKGIDTFYMPHPGSSSYNGCNGYWLATPNATNDGRVWTISRVARVGRDAYNQIWNDEGLCVRPVVSLPSNIQVTKNGNVWTVVQ